MGYRRLRQSPSVIPSYYMYVRSYLQGAGESIYRYNCNCSLSPMNQIVDSVGGDPHRYKPVTHSKMRIKPGGVLSYPYSTGSGGVRYNTLYPFWLPPSLGWSSFQFPTQYPFDAGYGIGSATFQAFVNDAVFEIRDVVTRKFDLLNMLRDLADIHSLLLQICKLIKKLSALLRQFPKIFGKSGDFWMSFQQMRETLRETSNLYLANKFGVEPLMREFEALAARWNSIQRSISFLERTAGKTFPARVSRTYSVPLDRKSWFRDDRIASGVEVQFRGSSCEYLYCASAVVFNGLPTSCLRGLERHLVELTNGLGLNRSVEFLWDLVPFSFVINWFFSIDNWIRNNLSPAAINSFLQFLDCGCSCKRSFSADIVGWHANGYVPLLDLGTLFVSNYQRIVGLPADASLYTAFQALTPDQQAVLAALVFQRA